MHKIFVSSTFLDFHAEREMMNNSVFPEFRKAAQTFGITPELIDLRWGVDNWSNGSDSITKTLDACFSAIKNSSAMIIFQGDRRGFLPEDIPDLIKEKFGITEKTDNNAKKTKLSITGLEIEYAMMLREKFDGKVIICVRNITSIPAEVRTSYIDDSAKEELTVLKDRLRKNYADSVIDYTAEWTGSALGNFKVGKESLADVLISWMKAMYLTEWEIDAGLSWQERELLISRRSIEDSRESFFSREKLIDDLEEKLKSHRYLFLKAPEGFGKTAVISRLAERLVACCLFAGSGLTTRPNNAQHMLELMVYYLETKFKRDHIVVQEEFNLSPIKERRFASFKLRLEELCRELPSDEPVFFMIDGFDKLEPDEHRDSADILPMTGNFHCLVSCSGDFELPATYKNSDECCVLGLETLTPSEASEILKKILGRRERELYAEAQSAALSHLELSPLKLSMAAKLLDIRITVQELEALKENPKGITALAARIIADISDDTAEAARDVLKNAAGRLLGDDAHIVLNTTEFLAVSRNGLRLSDLSALDENFSEAEFLVFVKYIDIFFMERKDGRINFRHDCTRKGLLATMTQEKIDDLSSRIAHHVLGLPADDALRNSDGFFYAQKFKDYVAAEKLIDEVFRNGNPLLQYEIDKHLMADEGKFCIELLREYWDFMSHKLRARLYSYLFIKAEVLSFTSVNSSVKKIFRKLSEMLTPPIKGKHIHSFLETAMFSLGSYGSEFVLARTEMLQGEFEKSAERCLRITKEGEEYTTWRKDDVLCLLMCSAYLLLADDMHYLSRHRRSLKYAEKAVEWAYCAAELYEDYTGTTYIALSRMKVSQCKLFALNSSHLPEIVAEVKETHKVFARLTDEVPSIDNLQYIVNNCWQMALLAILLKDPAILKEVAIKGEKYACELLSVSHDNDLSLHLASMLFGWLAIAEESLGDNSEAQRYAKEALRLCGRLKEHNQVTGILRQDMLRVKQEMLRIIAGKRAAISPGNNKDVTCYKFRSEKYS